MAIANYGGQSQQRWGDSTATTGETFRDLLITDLKGVPQQTMLARKKGMVLVAFFTTGDDASKQLLPLLQSLTDAYKEAGKLTVMAVSETDDDDAVAAFAKTNNITFPVMIDREHYHAHTYGFTVYPTVVLLTGAGIVAHKAKGAKAVSELQAIADKIGAFAGAETLAKLDGAAFTPAVMPPPPPPADPQAAPPKP